MKKIIFLLTALLSVNVVFGQLKEVGLDSKIDQVTVFFQGAQITRKQSKTLQPGRQIIVFKKLTDHLDQNSVQVKASGDLTILNVRTRKNFEDQKLSTTETEELTEKRKILERKEEALTNEYSVLALDKNLLMSNRSLKGEENGLSVNELKQAFEFMHEKMTSITNRMSEIEHELELLFKDINRIDQEILSIRSKPVVNYSEVLVEVDVAQSTKAHFHLNYISPNAQWTPYYDMRSDGIGSPVKLQAKALVNQNTGIEWNNVDLTLSTNDPYQSTEEPELIPWYINYHNRPNVYRPKQRQIPQFTYEGERVRGEVIDAETGEPLPFAKVTFPGIPNIGTITDFDGKFDIVVPKNARTIQASFIGYTARNLQITAPYLKFFIQPNNQQLSEVQVVTRQEVARIPSLSADADIVGSFSTVPGVQVKKKGRSKRRKKAYDQVMAEQDAVSYDANYAAATVTQKDLRVEYAIQTKLTIPSDGVDQRVSIDEFEMKADYEYHSVPKLEESVFLVAKVSGWEKLNLLNGESNMYFDGTYIGKSFVDANSLKDTLTFSLGKDNKIQIERKRIAEKSSNKVLGSRRKFEVTWEVAVKNNGNATIPLIIKDQYPISRDSDIKVKHGTPVGGKLDYKTKIITWRVDFSTTKTATFKFDYKVDYNASKPVHLE